jgi:dTDP-4-dehydrorhamnose reductase
MSNILITGANGQLGTCFQALADGPHHFIFAGSSDLDISDYRAVNRFFAAHAVDWCINCAAYTAVDKAESEPVAAKKINVTGTRNLAKACAMKGIPFIHFSTDYVYHGHQNVPIKETDPVSPKGVYARTKLNGERAAVRVYPEGTMVIRTSWVYAPYGNNFVHTMLRLGAERPVLNVVFDQTGTPTYAPDLAAAVLQIIALSEADIVVKNSIAGIWHYSNEGTTSWYDFATAIMEIKNLQCKVMPIETSQYPTPARRPPFSVLNKNKIKTAFGLEIPHWRESLKRCLEM